MSRMHVVQLCFVCFVFCVFRTVSTRSVVPGQMRARALLEDFGAAFLTGTPLLVQHLNDLHCEVLRAICNTEHLEGFTVSSRRQRLPNRLRRQVFMVDSGFAVARLIIRPWACRLLAQEREALDMATTRRNTSIPMACRCTLGLRHRRRVRLHRRAQHWR